MDTGCSAHGGQPQTDHGQHPGPAPLCVVQQQIQHQYRAGSQPEENLRARIDQSGVELADTEWSEGIHA
jgi:hypothetical protein